MSLSHFARGAVAAENGRRMMMLRGVTPNGHRLWDIFEAGNLRTGYPNYDAVVLINTRRTRLAHHGKASRMGITRPRSPEWDTNELTRLHRLFPHASKSELMAALPRRSWAALCARAWKEGYRRPARPRTLTGNYLLDQIYARASETNWSLTELDAECKSGGYFKRRKWKGGALTARYHFKAVEVLGGKVRVRWTAVSN